MKKRHYLTYFKQHFVKTNFIINCCYNLKDFLFLFWYLDFRIFSISMLFLLFFTKAFLLPFLSCLRKRISKLMLCALYNSQDLWPLMLFLYFWGGKTHFLQKIYMIYWSSAGTVKVTPLIKISVFPFSLFISTHQACFLPHITLQLFHLLLNT